MLLFTQLLTQQTHHNDFIRKYSESTYFWCQVIWYQIVWYQDWTCVFSFLVVFSVLFQMAFGGDHTNIHTQEFIGVKSESRVQWSKLCNYLGILLIVCV